MSDLFLEQASWFSGRIGFLSVWLVSASWGSGSNASSLGTLL